VSITFSAVRLNLSPVDPAAKYRRPYVPMGECDCVDRFIKDCDAAEATGADYPPVYSCEFCELEINLANANAADLFAWLGIPFDYNGVIDAEELAVKCRRRLWNEDRNHDPEIPGYEDKTPGRCSVIYTGRRPDYLRENTERMLKLAEYAGDNAISWG